MPPVRQVRHNGRPRNPLIPWRHKYPREFTPLLFKMQQLKGCQRMICNVEGCSRELTTYTTVCNAHYHRYRRTGAYGSAVIWDRKPRLCAVDDCDKRISGHGYCLNHMRHWQKYGDPLYEYVPNFAGENNPSWKGDLASYHAIHQRLTANRGRAITRICRCGAQAKQWSYDHTDPDERVSSEGAYSLDLSRYVPLCVSCHKRHDLSVIASKGAR